MMNWATQRGCFEKFSLWMIAFKWNGDYRFECHNSSWRIGAHFLCRFNRHPLQNDGVPLGGNTHNRRHTSRESSRH